MAKRFPLRVTKLRKDRGWDQSELAHRSGTSQSAISKIETGQQNVTLDTLSKVAEALGVHIVDLFEIPERRQGDDLIEAFQSLPVEDQELVLFTIRRARDRLRA